MAKQTKTEIQVPVHDPVPSVFADGLHGANVIAGCVRLDLFVERAWPGADKTQPLIVGRLVIPATRLEAFARGVNELAQRMKEGKTPKA